MFSRLSQFAGVCLIASLAGCGGDSGPVLPEGPTGTVSGKAEYNGNAVPEGSTVVFHPVSSSAIIATGTVDSSGGYKLVSRGQSMVAAGMYKVTVAPPDGGSVDATDEEAMRALYEGGGSSDSATATLPAKYATEATTDLEFEVEEGENTFDLSLKD